ncbi:unnamed protein product [Polarella glacialis]|uniref:Beta-catenin-like protein 1 N-terminal domain-containing protein n=1 Tax=Polarella glacialis TaxID=89957 RepID=A0A813GHS2_POLGL|nr:unnamed protein product [Polarella glacialis]
MSLQLERKVKVNQDLRQPVTPRQLHLIEFPPESMSLGSLADLRIKHADEPEKYLKSEVDLDEEVKKFVHVATHPHLYAELLKLGTIPVMVGLLNHVNTDIAVGVFEVLSELTDADVISETEEPEVFVRALFEAQLCQMTARSSGPVTRSLQRCRGSVWGRFFHALFVRNPKVDVLLRIDESASDDDAKERDF